MICFYRTLRLLIVCFILLSWHPHRSNACNLIFSNPDDSYVNPETDFHSQGNDPAKELEKLNSKISAAIADGDTVNSRLIVRSMLKILKGNNIDNLTCSASQFYIGIYYLNKRENSEAINWFRLSVSIRRQTKEDKILANCLYNMGIAYYNLGDYRKMEQYTIESLEVEKKLYGESSPALLSDYSSLVSAYFGQNEYSKAISTGNTALKLINGNTGSYTTDVANLYTSIGACYVRMSDYSKAALYLEKAESVYREFSMSVDDNYINLLNTLAVTYFFLGNSEKTDDYFNRGVRLIKSSNSSLSFNLINSFAIVLGNAGKIKKGESLIVNSLNKAKDFFGSDSRDYIEVLKNYAEYLRTFNISIGRSLRLYEECLSYVNIHAEDVSLKDQVLLGYALSLTGNGESSKALNVIQELLFRGSGQPGEYPGLGNPDPDRIVADQWSINLLKAKYRILRDLYLKNKDYDVLATASNTSELLVGLIEKVRINISEDDSRVILGDRYRDAYLYAIRDFDLCYRQTGDKTYKDKAFEYSEKSKVAGLLASTRELKATQFHIPPEIAELERHLKTEISFYNAMISEEGAREKTDASVVSEWKTIVLNDTQKRDSLISVLEKNYPDYYQIKYNTGVLSPRDIPGITGRNSNYLNYVVDDSVIYIFLTNRKYQELLTIPIDTAFFGAIRKFRSLLSNPMTSARTSFAQYQETGRILYNKIFEPVRKYLISDKLLISPDNILSYIPFEAIPAGNAAPGKTQFKDIPYLMDEYRISYTYSATLLAESLKKGSNFTNSLIAFAPVYTGTIDVDSLLITRQARLSKLRDLPYARMEAEFVTNLTNGKLFINNGARESVFKAEAGKYDIIHLAMHTVLNDQWPMYSKMLFYQQKDSTEDGNLNTYEVYGIPLKAKMVILSSCNTGTGQLHSGEGILSLARGFVYSGSQSVVMSMWEIDDRSGTEIVKGFYRNLKKGETKSNALRKARMDYLKNADMLRSHPYFWSSLVIYGNNTKLYPEIKYYLISGAFILLVILSLVFIFYSRKSLYSGSSFMRAIRASLLRYFFRRA